MSIEKYLEQLKANKLSDATIRNAKYSLIKLSEFKALSKITDKDLKTFFSRLNVPESSFALYQIIIKKYFKDIGKPEIAEWIKVRKPNHDIDPNSILTVEDVNKLIESTDSLYYKALMAFLFESGCRISEARSLLWKDFTNTTEGLIVHIKTKKTSAGIRKLILPNSSQYIKNWHAYSYGKPEDAVFPISLAQSNTMFKQIAKEAGISKSVHCHAFRHAQATDMVHRGYNETIIRKKLGWTPTSGMIARYAHPNDDAVVDATLESNGKIIKPKDRTEINPAATIKLEESTIRIDVIEEKNSQLESDNFVLQSRITELEANQNTQDREAFKNTVELLQSQIYDKDKDIEAMHAEMEQMKREQVSFFKAMKEKMKQSS